MWESIKYVSSGLTLIAFLAAVVSGILRSRWAERTKVVSSAREEDRPKVIALQKEFFEVETGALTQKQQFDIAMAQIQARSKRYTAALVSISLATFGFAALTAYAISRSGDAQTSKDVSVGVGSAQVDPCKDIDPPVTCLTQEGKTK